MRNKIFLGFVMVFAVAAASSASAVVFIDDDFNGYADGAIVDQGAWLRAPNSVTPPTNIQILDGAVHFNWTGHEAGSFHAVRNQWTEASIESGSIFAFFDLHVSQAPVDSENLRPSFFSFASSGGTQERGHVGLKAGSEPGTFQIGVSSSSQTQSAFTFGSQNLNINQTYQVMVEYQINPGSDSNTLVWLNTTNPLDAPEAVSSLAGSADNIRRVNLRMNTDGGSSGASDLGIFTLDNLQITTAPIPEPSHYALFFGAATLLFLGYRHRRS